MQDKKVFFKENRIYFHMQRNTTNRNLIPHFELNKFIEPAHKAYKRKANNSIADNGFISS